MGVTILLEGEPGSGKSTGMRTLDSKEVFWVSVGYRNPPFEGWKKKYITWSKESPDGNFIKLSKFDEINKLIDYVNTKRPEIKYILLDDFNYMASFELFEKIPEKGYDKFTVIANNIKRIITKKSILRDDLNLIVTMHPDVTETVDGEVIITAGVTGKMVSSQLGRVEGLFDIVFYAKPRKENKELKYGYETRKVGNHPGKTPMGMFTDEFIENDLKKAFEQIEEFENKD